MTSNRCRRPDGSMRPSRACRAMPPADACPAHRSQTAKARPARRAFVFSGPCREEDIMPSIIETTVYCLDELLDAGKEKARAWYRESGLDYDWFDFVYEDFERVCAIVGVRLDTVQVRLFGGGTRQEPCIRFSGFWN